MVTRKTKATGTRRRAVRPEPRRAPTAPKVEPRVAEMKERLDVAGHKLQLAGEKFQRLAGRHIVRDAAEMWQEMAPARRVLKLPVVRRAARPAA